MTGKKEAKGKTVTSVNATLSISRIGEAIFDFFFWWRNEMRQVIPLRLLEVLDTHQPSLELVLTKEGFVLDGNPVEPLSNLEEVLLSLDRDKKSNSVRIILDRTLYLERTISHQRLPLSTLRRAAELDLLTETPFNADDIHIVLTTQSQRNAAYAIVRRNIVDDMKKQFALADVEIAGICLGDDENQVISGLKLGDPSIPSKRRFGNVVYSALGVLALLAFSFAAYQIDQKTAEASEKLDRQIEADENVAHAARSKYDQYAKKMKQLQLLQSKQAKTLEVVDIWEELTHILPDTAFLTDLVIKADTLEITGFSEAPATLIGAIEASPLFEQAQFTSPVVKIPGFKGDRFLISFAREQG